MNEATLRHYHRMDRAQLLNEADWMKRLLFVEARERALRPDTLQHLQEQYRYVVELLSQYPA